MNHDSDLITFGEQKGRFIATEGETSCNLCSKGQFIDYTGATQCDNCQPGFFSNTTGVTTCEACAEETFQQLQGQIACHPCGTSRSCNADQFILGCGASSPGKCSTCESQANYQRLNTMVTTCKLSPCPRGTTSTKDDLTCTHCSEGQFRPFLSDLNCQACPSGRYEKDTGGHICTRCFAGWFHDDTGAVKWSDRW